MQLQCRRLFVVFAALSLAASAGTKVWTGLGANAKASTADNWEAEAGQDPVAPVTGDAVVFDATGRDHPCTWDLDIPLASWTQDGYTNIVTIQTVYDASGFDCLEITGNVLLNSGVWTHTANSSAETYRLRVDVGGNMTIGQDAVIHLTKKGYAPGKGPGSPGSTKEGAAHGGQSSASNSRCYGSITAPVNLGSGGSSANNREPYGGGALRLTIAGTLSHNGIIEADGRTYLSSGAVATYYGGAGGSVWITAGSMIGAGSISASSGRQSNSYYGGGGRVSLVLTDAGADFSGFTGEVKATSSYKGGYQAASGTVYYETAADGAGHGMLVVDGYSTSGTTYTDIFLDDQDAAFSPRRIEIARNARVRIRPGTRTTFTVSEAIAFTNSATFLVSSGATLAYGGTAIVGAGSSAGTISLASDAAFTAGGPMTFDKANLQVVDDSSVVCGPLVMTNGANFAVKGEAALTIPHLEIASGGTLTDDTPIAIPCHVVVRNGGTVTHSANTATTDYRIQMAVAGSLTVEAGGKIDTVGKGYPSAVGPGAGVAAGGGANHGGRGLGSSGTPNANVCYGSITRPTEIGSGIYRYAGSGAIKIVCHGPITNNGVITSCGYYSNVMYSSPGGSVWLTAASLVGSGYIQANALGDSTKIARNNEKGTTNRSGGGRVAVWLTDSGADFADFSGVISAWGCGDKSRLGGAGTVYLKTGDQTANEGTLIIDNRYNATTIGNTEIGEEVTDTEVGSIVIGLGSRVYVRDGQTLTVNGDMAITNATGNTFSMESGSSLVFAGASPATVSGNFDIAKLICQTPGKTLSFTDGSTLTVSELLTVEGEAGNPVSLGLAGDSGAWNLVLGNDAAQSVSYVTAEKSDASGGQEIVAINSTGSGTVNWRFENVSAGETIIWTGAESSIWSAAGNWDLGRAPITADLVVIPGGTANQPELVADTACAELTLAQGATLALAGFNLSVSGDATVAGALVASGSETLAFGGDLDLSQGSFTCASSTVVLNGAAAQSFTPGATAFYALVFSNTSAEGIVVSGSATTRTLSSAPGVATALTFANGASFTATVSLTLSGASAEAPLWLLPSTAAGMWQLRSLGIASISGVAVSNSTATANTLVAAASRDLGGNTGWVFGADNATTWTGAVDSDWFEAGNWSAGVPDDTTAVTIGSGASVTISSAAEARSLQIGDATLTVSAPLDVAEALVAGDGATLVLDKPVTVGASVVLATGSTVTHGDLGTALAGGIDLVVGGDLVVESGAAITATEKSSSTFGRNGGDGGGSHGGRTVKSQSGASWNTCYGSVYCPTNAGTMSSYSSRGGGIVRLRVAGRLAIDGTIDADGESKNANYYSGSGGSIWIEAGSIRGSGSISSDGNGGGSGMGGSGGRIAIYLTGEGETLGETPVVTAYGGHSYSDGQRIPKGAPGTIYIETAAHGARRGTVRVANHADASSGNQYVDYPSTRRAAVGDGQDATWRLSGYSFLYVTRDAKVADVWLEGSKPRIYLNGHTLRIRTAHHKLGTDESTQVIPGGTAENPGKIIWFNPTILLLK